ncbi:MAG: DEAD/DEAH box helicase [Candidatus Gastranaerophilaceae bacterium]|nr:DEAD/DEAH box helicase [Candidatus Gastranaerophilaceae bacterium]
MKVLAITKYIPASASVNSDNKTSGLKSISPNCINADNIINSMTMMSLKNISFGNSDFDKTVEANYFKLPKGAKADNFQKAAAQNILLDNDVLVTAPTGTGKTAIAHYTIGKNLHDGKKTFYTTPLKALSNEKFRDFQRIYGEDNVGILTGDTKINPKAPIIIMTTEVYRNMVFGKYFGRENELLDDLKTVIFDELHYLGDVDRGGIWEQSIFLSAPETQLLSLSATIGNNKDIAGWMAQIREHGNPEIVSGYNKHLSQKTRSERSEHTAKESLPIAGLESTEIKENNNSEIIEKYNMQLAKYQAHQELPIHTVLIDVPMENRHVPLEFENINVSDLTQPEKSKKKSNFNAQLEKLSKLVDKKGLIPAFAYNDVVKQLKDDNRLPAIFFVFDKKNSKDILEYLTKYGPKLTTDEEKELIMDTVERFDSEGKYLGETMDMKALLKGYAVHNAGLLPTQKELVEELFQNKLIKVVIATETLSAGINMPTRTTVITASRKPSSIPDGPDNKRRISANEFHQMAGRAGRRGIDTKGYCYTLSLNDDERSAFDMLVHSSPNNLKSALRPSYSFITKYYNELQNDDMLEMLFDKSFYTYNKNPQTALKNKQNLRYEFTQKINMLKNFDYLTSKNNLTEKGILISNLNGYEQIPVIEMVSSKVFEKMSAAEFAGAVGALANIEPKKDGQFTKTFDVKPKGYEWANSALEKYIKELNNTLNKYNDLSTKNDRKFRQIEINNELTNNIYKWAEMNSSESDSTQNWSKLYYNADKRKYKDEGTMFKGIMMTIDLLKQIQNVARCGTEIATNEKDFKYYTGLIQKADEAIALINKEPARVN